MGQEGLNFFGVIVSEGVTFCRRPRNERNTKLEALNPFGSSCLRASIFAISDQSWDVNFVCSVYGTFGTRLESVSCKLSWCCNKLCQSGPRIDLERSHHFGEAIGSLSECMVTPANEPLKLGFNGLLCDWEGAEGDLRIAKTSCVTRHWTNSEVLIDVALSPYIGSPALRLCFWEGADGITANQCVQQLLLAKQASESHAPRTGLRNALPWLRRGAEGQAKSFVSISNPKNALGIQH